MNTQTSLVATCIDQQDTEFQRSVTWANPQASDETLATFSTKLNDLSTNTLVSVTRVNKIKIV